MAFFTSLYSGSSGNCSVVRCGDEYLLIDMGKSCRVTLNALKALGLSVSGMKGLLVTHEHSDHVAGLGVFLKHYSVPVYGSAATLDHLDGLGVAPQSPELIAHASRGQPVGGVRVSAFPTSHDVPCCGFRITAPDGSVMAIATDLGCLTDPVHTALSGADLVALEANYDLHSLRYGSYPYYLKRRIESPRGHLDNNECAAKILELVQQGCKKFALCHLSKENNTPDLALGAVRSALVAAGVTPGPGVRVQAQKRAEPSDWMEF